MCSLSQWNSLSLAADYPVIKDFYNFSQIKFQNKFGKLEDLCSSKASGKPHWLAWFHDSLNPDTPIYLLGSTSD